MEIYEAGALALKETAVCLITFDPTEPDLDKFRNKRPLCRLSGMAALQLPVEKKYSCAFQSVLPVC